MALEPETPRFQEWGISDPTAEFSDFLVHAWGPRCEDTLGNLFMCYLRNEGDVSDWGDRALFGRFIAEHSSIPPDEVAVYLNYPSALDMFEEAPKYEVNPRTGALRFHGIEGEPRILVRVLFESLEEHRTGSPEGLIESSGRGE